MWTSLVLSKSKQNGKTLWLEITLFKNINFAQILFCKLKKTIFFCNFAIDTNFVNKKCDFKKSKISNGG